MKTLILISIWLLFFKIGFSQEEKDSVILNSLAYLNNRFHLNFEKEGKYILIIYDGDYYIYNKYHKEIENNLPRIRIIYELKKLETNKYYFSLKWAGELKGTFYYINGKFDKLKYAQSTD